MNGEMEYRGYRAKVQFSQEDHCFVGRVLGVSDILAFDGRTAQEAAESFRVCIDDYLGL